MVYKESRAPHSVAALHSNEDILQGDARIAIRRFQRKRESKVANHGPKSICSIEVLLVLQ